jgi:hypothetical protein
MEAQQIIVGADAEEVNRPGTVILEKNAVQRKNAYFC